MGDFLLYTSIRDYLYARITLFTEQVLSQNLQLALTTVFGLLTLWIIIQGYLIVTGRSQEGIKGFVYGLGKSYFIIAVALGVASSNSFSVRLLTDNLTDGISQVMTGKSDMGSECLTQKTQSIIGCRIDLNLKATQIMMSRLSGIDTADNEYLENKLTEARWFTGVGTAGPAMVAGTMLIMFRIAMALFVGFAPIFILCLLFKKTAPLFQKWLYYGLATIFSGVMLGVMSEISMELITNIAIAEAAGNITSILTGGDVGGIMQTVTQQLGLGLMLSTLLITVPPMAGMWFNGVMASYSGYNAIAGWNGGQPATPPGMNSQSQVEQRANQVSERMIRDQNQLSAPTSNSIVNTGYTNSPNTGSDHIKNYQNNLYQRSERLVSADSKSSDDKKTKT
ncbi:type IV secretion system protein [uncultured Neisseria sp.]|uniref:type IV secretion system protein n=1 Tax=uncultured Neisseria sp. TaxID=237778 RepID=UPI002613B4D0|nr:type IV secretion system protein [uncultured Neisseria sp.]